MRRILITGAEGKLGSALVRALSTRHDIVQLSLNEPTDPAQREVGTWVQGSILDLSVVQSAIEGVDTVIHCAAIPFPMEPGHAVVETNVLGTYNVLQAAGKSASVERFVYLSSARWHGVYDEPFADHLPAQLPIEEAQSVFASDVYSMSKVQGEDWCRQYVRRYTKPVVAFRPVYIIPQAEMPGFGAVALCDNMNLYDYVGTDDVVDAIARGMDYDPPDGFDVFLLAAPDQSCELPSLELADRRFPGVRVDKERLASCGGFGSFMNCDHAREALGWDPQYRCKR